MTHWKVDLITDRSVQRPKLRRRTILNGSVGVFPAGQARRRVHAMALLSQEQHACSDAEDGQRDTYLEVLDE